VSLIALTVLNVTTYRMEGDGKTPCMRGRWLPLEADPCAWSRLPDQPNRPGL